jgi:hypothetical protein
MLRPGTASGPYLVCRRILPSQQKPHFLKTAQRLMEKELNDRAAAIHDRLTQLRDSL